MMKRVMRHDGAIDNETIELQGTDAFEKVEDRSKVSGALRSLDRMASQARPKGFIAFIIAETGMGKTFLANCIARALLDQGYPVIYFTAFQFFDLVEKHTFSHDPDDHSDEDYENLLNCDLLILDDIGTELSNNFTRSQLFAILNERLIRKHPTILTTNLSLADLKERYDERIFSRTLGNYTLIKLFGDDIRLQRKFNNTPAT